MKLNYIKIINILIGIFVSGIGTAILFNIGWGSAPISTLTEGLAHSLNTTYGMSNLIINGISLLITLMLSKKLIGVGTILSTFLFGYFIDLAAIIVQPLNINEWSFPATIIAFTIGTILSAAGVGYYIAMAYGLGAIDALAMILFDKTKLTFTQSRWLLDFSLATTGILLGGSWGIGTIVTVVFSGPIINYVINSVNKHSEVINV